MTKITTVTGDTLINWGFKPGKWFQEAILAADSMARDNHFGRANWSEDKIRAVVKSYEPAKLVINDLQDPRHVPIHYNVDAHTEFEKDNLRKVAENVAELATVPIVRSIALMPDAC